jgi:hypothetical protein
MTWFVLSLLERTAVRAPVFGRVIDPPVIFARPLTA